MLSLTIFVPKVRVNIFRKSQKKRKKDFFIKKNASNYTWWRNELTRQLVRIWIYTLFKFIMRKRGRVASALLKWHPHRLPKNIWEQWIIICDCWWEKVFIPPKTQTWVIETGTQRVIYEKYFGTEKNHTKFRAMKMTGPTSKSNLKQKMCTVVWCGEHCSLLAWIWDLKTVKGRSAIQ